MGKAASCDHLPILCDTGAQPIESSVCVFQTTEPHGLDRYIAQGVEKARGCSLGHSASFAEEM